MIDVSPVCAPSHVCYGTIPSPVHIHTLPFTVPVYHFYQGKNKILSRDKNSAAYSLHSDSKPLARFWVCSVSQSKPEGFVVNLFFRVEPCTLAQHNTRCVSDQTRVQGCSRGLGCYWIDPLGIKSDLIYESNVGLDIYIPIVVVRLQRLALCQ